MTFLLFGLTALSFASPEPMLECQSPDTGARYRLFRDGDRRFIEYRLSAKEYFTELKPLSGAELMGEEGDWLVFFEQPQREQFLFTVWDHKKAETIAGPEHLDCGAP